MGIKKDFYKRLSIIVIISVVIISFVVIKKQRDILLEDMRDKGESIARVLSTVTMDSMLTYDYVTMERYVRQVVQDKNILSLRIVRTDGEVLAESKRTGNEKGAYITSYPIEMGDSKLGMVEVSFSMERVNAISREIFITAAVFIIIIHGIGFVLNNIIINNIVIRPVRALMKATKEIKEGGLKNRIRMNGDNEFSELSLAFNDMADSLDNMVEDLNKGHKEIQTEKTKLETIVHSLADGLFVTDSDGLIASFNGAAEFISGYSRDEVVGKDCESIFKSRFCDDACALHSEGRIIRNKETEIITKDGRRRIVSVSSAILRDSEGKIIGGVQTFRDITEEKQQQAMLCHAEKLAAVGQMSAGIAHEINNPLGNILGFAKLLRKDSKTTDSHKEKLNIVIEQANKASDIVQGLLSFARQREPRSEKVSINDIIENVLRLLLPKTEKRGIKVAVQLEDIPYVKADPKQIEQVFFNILLNAIQAIETSGNAGNVRVQSRTSDLDNHVEITIADDGPGIPENIKHRIFDPFFTTKPAGKGTGLGLSICLGIIKEHTGTIDFTSETGKGNAFTVRLPIDKSHA